jgi:4-amino-4-deoxy-L-arabinose transferase-like glycosyltransferase
MNSQPLAASRAPEKLTHPTAYLLRVVLIAFLLRVGGMFLIHSYRVNLENDEASHIAASLASGEGFSSPFGQHTGPTAWLGPVYPFVLSRIFVAFGTQTRAAIFAALLLNCLLSALTVIPVFFIAEYSLGLRIAKWSLWTWTLFPYAMYWGMRWIWDTALSALLLTLLFWFTLHLAQSSTLKKWVLYGLLWGLAGLTNTAELAFLPFAGIWICYQQFRQGKPFFRNAVVGAILFFAAVTPWIVRDYVVFHKFIPIRGNFGLEFHLGNTAEATGMWQVWLHPSQNLGEFHEYQRLGEIAYIHSKLEETLQFIRQRPKHFAFLLCAHFMYYWSESPHVEAYFFIYQLKFFFALAASVLAVWGLVLALRQRLPGAGLYLLLLLSYPIIYYITFAHARYRHPIEPELVILILFFISQVEKEVRATNKS